MSERHRLCLWISDPDDPSGRNLLGCDQYWTAAMDEAIALAAAAAEGTLDVTWRLFLHARFIRLLPPPDDPEHLSEAAYAYYRDHRPPLSGPWSARDVADFVLAGAHRYYAHSHSLAKWLASHFESNPVGLPRSRAKFPRSRNYTPRGIRLYRAYGRRAVEGVARARLSPLERGAGGWAYREPEAPEVALIETTDKLWLNIRPPQLEPIWPHVDRLHAQAMGLAGAMRNDLTAARVLELTAQVHWWLSQAMPYRRGSAAIADMLCKQLLQSNGMTTPPWRREVAPDVEAYCSTLEGYVERYPGLFEEVPGYHDAPVPALPSPRAGLLEAATLAAVTGGRWDGLTAPGVRFSEARFAELSRATPGALLFTTNPAQWGRGRPDTERHLERAFWHGVGAAVVRRAGAAGSSALPRLLVEDTRTALLAAARAARARFDGKTVCITGSDGKTSLKFLLHHLLRAALEVQASGDAGNKLYPIACTLAGLRRDDRVALLEAGIVDGTDGTVFADLIRPDLCVFSDLGPNHLDSHGGIDAMLDHKAALATAPGSDGACVVNADAPLAAALLQRLTSGPGRVYRFGSAAGCDGRLLDARYDDDGWSIEAVILGRSLRYRCGMFGEHIPLLTVGALLLTQLLGVDAERATARFAGYRPHPNAGRVETIRRGAAALLLYDDTRRSSFLSLASVIKMTRRAAGRPVTLVLGAVPGLGRWHRPYLDSLAGLLAETPPRRLFLVGKGSVRLHARLREHGVEAVYVERAAELEQPLLADLRDGEWVILKGQPGDELGPLAERIRAG